jgi:hypothetical protein
VAPSQAGDILRNPGILQEVCRFLTDHSLYVSLVCKDWKHCYELAAAESELNVIDPEVVEGVDSDYEDTKVLQVKQIGAMHVTLYKAAFASAATVQCAQRNGLSLTNIAVTRSAGKHGSLKALAEVYELRGNWDSSLTEGAAARGMRTFSYIIAIVDAAQHSIQSPSRKLTAAASKGIIAVSE